MWEFAFIALYAVIIALVIEIGVILFHMTGLEKEIARYQVISMLTGTGFTTQESALIIDHPIRRRISSGLILFGYFSLAVIISSIATILSNDLRIELLLIIIGILFVFLFIFRNKSVFNRLEDRFEHEMDTEYNLEDWPMKTALALDEEEMVAIIQIKHGSDYIGQKGRTLVEESLDVVLLIIRRGDEILRFDLFEVELQEGDKIMIIGKEDHIKERYKEMLSEDET
ncbi:TrkA C-terminal domain-containing protein [Planomicrobium okeanokoites]|uniref:TrkA C-terminal domain-containing protein n=1 Tax=Planomicrobium okeanokoites TaxID=244 RepID=UPI002492836C|nr:TrkA C-terminal domain-containing protein [Planomicrobium okeanokoites]